MPRSHIVILLIFSLVCLAPLFYPGLYSSHDGQSHLVRIYHFYYLLLHGHLLPRWDPILNYNLGYPIFDFMSPIPYYLTSLFMFTGSSVVNSFKLVLISTTVFGTYFYYLWIFKFTSSSKAALVSAMLFLFTPYRFVDLYVRADLGELVIIALLPCVFYCITSRKKVLLAISIALLPLAHPPLAVVFLPIVIVFAVLNKYPLKHLTLFSSLGLLLSAFFWLPAITLTRFTKFTLINSSTKEHLLTFKQIIYSPWGFGFSPNGLSFQLGIGSWIILGLITVVAIKSNWLIRILVAICWTAIIMMTNYSSLLWNFKYLQFLQFPWRLLSVPLIILPLCLGYLVSKYHSAPKIILAMFLAILLYSNRNHIRVNESQFISTPDSYFYQINTTTTSTPDELMPKVYNLNTPELFSSSPLIIFSKYLSLIFLALLIAYEVFTIKPWSNRFQSAS